jgi:hypothetical protein
MRQSWIVAAFAAAALSGCATETTQRDRDVSQCSYGVVVPHNITPAKRKAYIDDSVAGCLRAKGYADDTGA